MLKPSPTNAMLASSQRKPVGLDGAEHRPARRQQRQYEQAINRVAASDDDRDGRQSQRCGGDDTRPDAPDAADKHVEQCDRQDGCDCFRQK